MSTAEVMWARLRGLFCIYKPAGIPMGQVIRSIQEKLTRELNSMPCRPPRKIIQFTDPPEGGTTSIPTITTVHDLAAHTLESRVDLAVLGPRYMHEDFSVHQGDTLATHVSGVQLMALGTPQWIQDVVKARHIRVYEIKAELGRATHDHSSRGRTAEKTTYDHVTPAKMDRVIAAMQAGHQKNMLISAKVDLQSQKAYKLALQGLARAVTPAAGPVIYGFKCTDFSPPYFTVEVHSINETAAYLGRLVHELGLEMRTGASVTQVRRVRYGRLHLQHALLHKHWTAQHISHNIALCRPLLCRERLGNEGVIEREHAGELLSDGS